MPSTINKVTQITPNLENYVLTSWVLAITLRPMCKNEIFHWSISNLYEPLDRVMIQPNP